MKIADIEGIGPVWAKKLSDAGVRTTDALLKNGGTKKARQALADKTGLAHAQILEWVNRADLYRIKGVGSEYSDLLERAGVDTVVELANRNAANMAKAIKDLVGKTGPKVVRRIPSDREITSWVTQAKKLPRAVEYQTYSCRRARGAAFHCQWTHPASNGRLRWSFERLGVATPFAGAR